jgi:hypothetical protein
MPPHVTPTHSTSPSHDVSKQTEQLIISIHFSPGRIRHAGLALPQLVWDSTDFYRSLVSWGQHQTVRAPTSRTLCLLDLLKIFISGDTLFVIPINKSR